MKIICAHCGKETKKDANEVDRARLRGHKLYCGFVCAGRGRRKLYAETRPPLTQARLRDVLLYDHTTGLFFRKTKHKRWANKPSGCCKRGPRSNGGGYIVIDVDGVAYRAHRLAFLFMNGRWPIGDLDHINGNRSDNRILNLREATRSQNNCNASLRRNNKSGVTGVSWVRKLSKWTARVSLGNAPVYLGVFNTFDEAVTARKAAANKHYREFAPTTRRMLRDG